MPPTNLINDIEAEARNRNTVKNGNTQLTALSGLVATMEKNQKLESSQNMSLAKLDKTINSLNKNINNMLKGSNTSGKYSAGFDKTLYQMQAKEISKSFKSTDMGETNRLLKALLAKKTEININNESKGGGGLGLLSGLGDMLKPAALGTALAAALALALKDKKVRDAIIDGTKDAAVATGGAVAANAPAGLKYVPAIVEKVLSKIPLIGSAIPTMTKGISSLVAASTKAVESASRVGMAHAVVAGSKMASRAVPVAGAGLSAAAATDDWQKGNYVGSVLNTISGAADLASVGIGATGIGLPLAGAVKGGGLAAGAGAIGSEIIMDIMHPESRDKGWIGNAWGTAFGKKQEMAQVMAEGVTSPSEDYINRLKQSEGFLSTPEYDINGLAIGYGNHYYPDGSKVLATDNITEPEADKLLRSIASQKVARFISKINVPLKQSQVDALLDLSYNSGTVDSEIINALNSGDNKLAADLYAKNRITAGVQPNAVVAARRASYAPLMLKDGGITRGATNAIIGEAGREAVIPLESDEGIGALAESMGKYNMKDGNTSAILLQILNAVSSSNVIGILQDINKNIQESSTMVSVSGFSGNGATA